MRLRRKRKEEDSAKLDLYRIVAEKYREAYDTGERVEGSVHDKSWDLGGGVILYRFFIGGFKYSLVHVKIGAHALGCKGEKLLRKADDERMRAEDSAAVQGFLGALTE